MWPQFLAIITNAIAIGIALAKDGEPKTGKHSFIASVVAAAINLYVMYAGGFFDNLLK